MSSATSLAKRPITHACATSMIRKAAIIMMTCTPTETTTTIRGLTRATATGCLDTYNNANGISFGSGTTRWRLR